MNLTKFIHVQYSRKHTDGKSYLPSVINVFVSCTPAGHCIYAHQILGGTPTETAKFFRRYFKLIINSCKATLCDIFIIAEFYHIARLNICTKSIT